MKPLKFAIYIHEHDKLGLEGYADDPYLEFDFFPETWNLPEIQAEYAETNFWYSTSSFLIYRATRLGVDQIILYVIANSEKESPKLIEKINRARALCFPRRLGGNVLLPPPRVWFRVWDWDNGVSSGLTSGIGTNPKKGIGRTHYLLDISQNFGAVLVRVESVLVQILQAFPNGLPRYAEITFSYREIQFPYKTITMSDILKSTIKVSNDSNKIEFEEPKFDEFLWK